MFTFEVSEGQQEDHHARDDPGRVALLLEMAGLPERVADDQVEADAGVEHQVIPTFRFVAKGEQVHQVVEKYQSNVEADSVPVKFLTCGAEINSING